MRPTDLYTLIHPNKPLSPSKSPILLNIRNFIPKIRVQCNNKYLLVQANKSFFGDFLKYY